MMAENDARPAGDPEIVWDVGYYLAPSQHGRGRGVMTLAVTAPPDRVGCQVAMDGGAAPHMHLIHGHIPREPRQSARSSEVRICRGGYVYAGRPSADGPGGQKGVSAPRGVERGPGKRRSSVKWVSRRTWFLTGLYSRTGESSRIRCSGRGKPLPDIDVSRRRDFQNGCQCSLARVTFL